MVLQRIWRVSNGLESTMFAAEMEWGGVGRGAVELLSEVL